MKNLSIVVLVSLLINMVTYGQESGWRESGNYVRLRQSSDKVGIGTTNPKSKFKVLYNSVGPRSKEELSAIYANNTGTDNYYHNPIAIFGLVNESKGMAIYGKNENLNGYGGYFVGKGYFSGSVGIGTTTPDYKLDVNGTIRAKEIKVETGWSDFVFEDDYNLMPLDKLDKHIKANKSLPGIPTEKEVLENGVELGEMQAKFLEKIEELTLYTITQEQRLAQLEKENKELKNRISALEK